MRSTLAVCAAVLVAAVGCSGNDGGDETASDATSSTEVTQAPATGEVTAGDPVPPQVPRDFTWTGRYLVPDLDLEVPFRWHGSDGDFQMVAGGEDHPIHFTNLIHDGTLYTLTYEWPGVPRNPCSNVGAFTLEDLNEGLAEAAFVGRETLHDREPREVHHFRSTGVWEVPPELVSIPGVPFIRIPLMSGDIYSDASDSTVFWKVLQFGVQNLYDEQLDEWMVIDEVSSDPGTVELPEECATAEPLATSD